MANLVQIRRGQSVPEDGMLQPYELGYRLVPQELVNAEHRNDREFYIGEKNLDKTTSMAVPIKSKRIDLSYFNSDIPCIVATTNANLNTENLPLGTLIIEVEE